MGGRSLGVTCCEDELLKKSTKFVQCKEGALVGEYYFEKSHSWSVSIATSYM